MNLKNKYRKIKINLIYYLLVSLFEFLFYVVKFFILIAIFAVKSYISD